MVTKQPKSQGQESKAKREDFEKTRDKERAQERRFKVQTHSSKYLTF